MSFLLGVDGGGTKTAFALYSLESGEIKHIITESLCPNDHGIEKLKAVISYAVRELSDGRMEDIRAACLGIPCYGEAPLVDKQTKLAVQSLFGKANVICTNDCVVGFAGALGLKPGISIVAGTGAIAYGESSSGKSARSNGWSSEFSDEGSCCWLGKKCIELFCKQADGRLPREALYSIIREELDLREDMDIICFYEKKLKGSRRELASMQKHLYKAACCGDTSAVEAYRLAAAELVCSIEAVRRTVGLEGNINVSYAGGLFKTGDIIFKPLTEMLNRVYNKYVLQNPRFTPEVGALLMAASSIGADTDIIMKNSAGMKYD